MVDHFSPPRRLLRLFHLAAIADITGVGGRFQHAAAATQIGLYLSPGKVTVKRVAGWYATAAEQDVLSDYSAKELLWPSRPQPPPHAPTPRLTADNT